ncbi:uncharacterized protein C3orf14-like [Pomacea canaliculata]|uniref:uncharacterized protein C3orf14-like n=1 Tax=Pomacea canaliculata TaxID=400727 RepID=UPI000D731B21|nr:uncharacterized protein C3orf14-like [Pomacea canaliculata]
MNLVQSKASTENDWGVREAQLETLHQEILFQREALLHSSSSVIQGPILNAGRTNIYSESDARLRNLKLLKDIDVLDEEMNCHPSSSSKFVILQNNYWSMVRSLLPLWEESLNVGNHLSQQQKIRSRNS